MEQAENVKSKVDILFEKVLILEKTLGLKNYRYIYFKIYEIREEIRDIHVFCNEYNNDMLKIFESLKRFEKENNYSDEIKKNHIAAKELEIQWLFEKYPDFKPKEKFEILELNKDQNEQLKKWLASRLLSWEELIDKINLVENLNENQNKKTNLETMALLATIILGSLPILSFSGLIILYIYLSQLNLDDIFMDVGSDIGGIWFFIAAGIFIVLTQFLFPGYALSYGDVFLKEYKSIEKKKGLSKEFLRLGFSLPLLCLYLLGFIFSLLGFSSLYDENIAFFSAVFWVLVIGGLHWLKSKNNKKNHLKKFLPVIMLLLFFIPLFSIPKLVKPEAEMKLEPIARVIRFKQKDYAFFKLNQNFFERTGVAQDDLQFLKQKYQSPSELKRQSNDLYLYGKIWVNAKNIKIFYPAKIITNKEGRQTVQDIDAASVGDTCIQLQAGELQRMVGLMPSKEELYKE